MVKTAIVRKDVKFIPLVGLLRMPFPLKSPCELCDLAATPFCSREQDKECVNGFYVDSDNSVKLTLISNIVSLLSLNADLNEENRVLTLANAI